MNAPWRVELDPGPDAELGRLEKAGRWDLLDRIDEAVAGLATDPGSKRSRERSFTAGETLAFGVTIRTRDEDWLLIWEQDSDVIVVRCIGPDPFA